MIAFGKEKGTIRTEKYKNAIPVFFNKLLFDIIALTFIFQPLNIDTSLVATILESRQDMKKEKIFDRI